MTARSYGSSFFVGLARCILFTPMASPFFNWKLELDLVVVGFVDLVVDFFSEPSFSFDASLPAHARAVRRQTSEWTEQERTFALRARLLLWHLLIFR